MRNPLNAIIGQSTIHLEILDRLKQWIDSIKGKLSSDEVTQISRIIDEYSKDH